MSGHSGYSAFAKYYDRLTENVDYPARAAYFDEMVGRFAPELRGGLLLDLACGTGSLALSLAALGYEVIGADASAEMLSMAMQKAGETGQEMLFLRQSMGALDLYGTVDLVVCALDSLNHLPGEAAVKAAMARVSLFLNPGGLFLFDVNTSYKHRSVLADNAFVYELEGLVCLWQNSYDPQEDRVDMALDFFEEQADGAYRRSSERFSEWAYPRKTLERLLEEQGLTLLAVFGEDSFDPPGEHAQRAVYVARKR